MGTGFHLHFDLKQYPQGGPPEALPTQSILPEPMSGYTGFGQWGICGTAADKNSPYWYPDIDGDGYGDGDEVAIGTSKYARCGVADVTGPSEHWPSDLVETALSRNRIDIVDVGDFIAPIRRLGTNPGSPNFRARNDLKPGSNFGATINIADIAAMALGVSGFPPMFGGARAYGGPSCTD